MFSSFYSCRFGRHRGVWRLLHRYCVRRLLTISEYHFERCNGVRIEGEQTPEMLALNNGEVIEIVCNEPEPGSMHSDGMRSIFLSLPHRNFFFSHTEGGPSTSQARTRRRLTRGQRPKETPSAKFRKFSRSLSLSLPIVCLYFRWCDQLSVGSATADRYWRTVGAEA